jgi:hypothetical protein
MYVRDHSLPEVDKAAERYAEDPSDETLRMLTLAAAPWSWNSGTGAVARGRALLERLPYNHQAAAWANTHFDAIYRARWTPMRIPTMKDQFTADETTDLLKRLDADEAEEPWLAVCSFLNPHDDSLSGVIVWHRRCATTRDASRTSNKHQPGKRICRPRRPASRATPMRGRRSSRRGPGSRRT